MSYASAILRGYYTTPFGSGGEWSGRRKLLTTDASGALVNDSAAAIYDLVIGDTYFVGISGPVIPNVTLISATLYVNTGGGVNVLSQAGELLVDGDAGTYSVAFFLSPTMTRLLSTTFDTWSVVLASNIGDRYTPVNGKPIKAKASSAV